jgi:hypothetical protein
LGKAAVPLSSPAAFTTIGQTSCRSRSHGRSEKGSGRCDNDRDNMWKPHQQRVLIRRILWCDIHVPYRPLYANYYASNIVWPRKAFFFNLCVCFVTSFWILDTYNAIVKYNFILLINNYIQSLLLRFNVNKVLNKINC